VSNDRRNHRPHPSRILSLLAIAATTLCLVANATAQTETLISSLPHSLSGMIFDSAGNLYGTTDTGGDFTCGNGFGCGTAFKLSPSSSGSWTQTVINTFEGGTHGIAPSASLVFDTAGNLYGTTINGGDYKNCPFGCGIAFRLSPVSDGSWTEQRLRWFTGGKDGAFPSGPVIFDSQGNLYGTTSAGGLLSGCGGAGCGTVYELSPTSNPKAPWKLTLLHVFTGGADGSDPRGPLVFDASGNLYGVTHGGGNFGTACGPLGCGVAFKLTPSSAAWPETILHTFVGTDGSVPNGGLVFDGSHHLYGTTSSGGAHNWGEVFKLSTVLDNVTVLYAFTGGSDGGVPTSGVIFDNAGNLYGTSNGGFANGCDGSTAFCGQVFKLAPVTTGWQLSAQYPIPFLWNPPAGGLVLDHAGNIYGIANEDLFFGDGGGAYQVVP
jgi:uncharacterized repeat protein (TIGR03803 family)